MADQTLDMRGASCPIPVLKTKKTLQTMPKGATLELFATDIGAVSDVPAFCHETKNTLLEQTEKDGVYRFLIKHTSP
jgi:tRNA 2-thiouridine synthesizing protein A